MSDEVKAVLTLDDAGFTIKVRQAGENLLTLDKRLSDTGKASKALEGVVKETTSSLNNADKSSKALGSTLEALQKRFREVQDQTANYAGVGNAAAKTLNDVATSSERAALAHTHAAAGADAYRVALDALKPSMRGAQTGAATLAEVQTAAAKTAVAALKLEGEERIAALGREKQLNEQTVAGRRRTLQDLRELERQFRAQALGKDAEADAAGARKVKGSAAERDALRAEANRFAQNAEIARQSIVKLEAELTSLAGTTKARTAEIEQQIGAIRQQMQLEERAAEKAKQDQIELNRLKRERIAMSRAETEARAINSQMDREAARHARDMLNTWKAIGQLAAGAKLNSFLGGSREDGSELQKAEFALRALKMPIEQTKETLDRAWDTSKVLGYVAATDALRASLAGIGGLGGTPAGSKEEKLERVITPLALQASQNLKNMFTNRPERVEDEIRNIYGLIEARGQTSDIEASKRTVELYQKIVVATQGKLTIQDLETFFRRTMANAPQISDDGLLKLVALMDQAKVSGGGGGSSGAGSGVSTIGTAVRMIQKMMDGGLKTVSAAEIFTNAGLIDSEQFMGADARTMQRELRRLPLNLGTLPQTDPVEAMRVITDKFYGYMMKPENVKKYFGDADVNDPEARRSAISKLINQLGFSSTAAAILSVNADPRVMRRSDLQFETARNSMSIDEAKDMVSGGYAQAVDEFSASWKNLKTVLGESVLPILTSILDGFTSIVKAGAEFFQNSGKVGEFAAQWTTVGLQLGAVVLTAKGLLGIFGMMGGSVSAGALLAGTGIGKLSGAIMGLGSFLMRWLLAVPGAFLVGFDLGGVIAKLEVGGYQISTWAAKLAELIVASFKGMSYRIAQVFTFGSWDAYFKDLEKENKDRYNQQNDPNYGRVLPQTSSVMLDTSKGGATFAFDPLAALTGPQRAAPSEMDKRSTNNLAPLDYPDRIGARAIQEVSRKEREREDQIKLGAGAPRQPRELEDRYAGEMARNASSIARARREYGNLGGGDLEPGDQAMANARDAFIAMWTSGSLDKGGDANKREFLTQGSGFVPGAQYSVEQAEKFIDFENEKVRAMIKSIAAIETYQNALKSLDSVTKRQQNAATDLQAAEDRRDGAVARRSAGMVALEREFNRARVTIQRTAGELDAFNRVADVGLYQRAVADLLNFTTDLEESIKPIFATEQEQITAEQDRTLRKTNEIGERRIKEATDRYDAALAAIARGETKDANGNALNKDEEVRKYEKAVGDARTALDRFGDAQARIRADALGGPVLQTLKSWGDGYRQLQGAQNDWLNSLASGIDRVLSGGKFGFKEFFLSIARDLQQILTRGLISDGLRGLFQGSSVNEGPGFASRAISGVGSFIGGMFGGAQGAGSEDKAVDGLGKAAKDATGALNTMEQKGVRTTTQGLVSQAAAYVANLLGLTAQTSATGSQAAATFVQTLAMENLTFWTNQAAAAMATAATSSTASSFFANGGIMSSSGSLPLNFYENGGIANSPQVAIFGEGRMNEAYVPLPDGRSIPVTLKNSDSSRSAVAGNSVEININVATDGSVSETSASESATSADYRAFAGNLKAAVIGVITEQQRPGGVLYGSG